MRRLNTFILILILAFSGCGRSGGGTLSDKLSVVATIFAPYDFSREILGGRADIIMLLPPGSESHTFEPTPQDIIKIQSCDVFIYVGGESDAWVEGILKSMDTSAIEIVTLMDCVVVLEEELVEGMEAVGGDEAEYDEHVWTSPKNAKLIVRKLSDAFCAADEANAGFYRENTAAYLGKLDELDAAFRAVVDAADRNTIVFGDRFPFRYLADAYGLNYYAAFPGCASETEPSAGTVAFLIDKVRTEGIPVVFRVELSNGRIAETISEATGAEAMLLHACHNISQDDFQNGAGYLDLMTNNVRALEEALR